MIEITMLGTAALAPIPERFLASAALTSAGRTILFDCGEGTQIALRREHISPQKIGLIALTHYHGDHLFGLPGLLQTMFQEQRTEPLYIAGPGDCAKILTPFLYIAGALPFEIRLVRIPEDGVRLDALCPGWAPGSLLRAYPTAHSVQSQCYRFDLPRAGKFDPDRANRLGVPQKQWKLLQHGESVRTHDGRTVRPEDVMGQPRRGLSFCFSGDTTPCPSLIEAARGVDLFICEATYGDNADEETAKKRGHSTFALTGKAAAEAGAQRLWMTHFSQSVRDPEEFLPNAEVFFPGAVCGVDGMRETLRFSEN